jgi:hypothetical protein
MEGTRDPEAAREQRRSAIVAQIPASYRPALHLAIPTVVGLGAMVWAFARIHALRPAELVTVPLTLLAAFGFEWRAHKDILHRRMPLLGVIYERHELSHHVIYTDRDMAMQSPREMWLVLMPPYAILLIFFGLVLPLSLGITRLLGQNVAMLFVATDMAFFLSYEWLHLAYHLPKDHPIGRLPLLARLRAHHQRHHDPRLMKRWNFNVTVPLFDWLHRTIWSPEREALWLARRRARRTVDRAAAPRGSL